MEPSECLTASGRLSGGPTAAAGALFAPSTPGAAMTSGCLRAFCCSHGTTTERPVRGALAALEIDVFLARSGLSTERLHAICSWLRAIKRYHEADAARAAIVGSSGSGKSRLAGRLASELGVAHVELDAVHQGPRVRLTRRAPREQAGCPTNSSQPRVSYAALGNSRSRPDLAARSVPASPPTTWPPATTTGHVIMPVSSNMGHGHRPC